MSIVFELFFILNQNITGMDKTSWSLYGCPEGGCPRHVERNYVPLFGVTQSNVDLRNYVRRDVD